MLYLRENAKHMNLRLLSQSGPYLLKVASLSHPHPHSWRPVQGLDM
ncbi:MAG: hypothetical protein QMC46_01560 [Burkholderiaceae bacterium]